MIINTGEHRDQKHLYLCYFDTALLLLPWPSPSQVLLTQLQLWLALSANSGIPRHTRVMLPTNYLLAFKGITTGKQVSEIKRAPSPLCQPRSWAII